MGSATGGASGRRRQRGSVETLPSGALRVKVYAGTDIFTQKRLDLTRTIPDGPDKWALADAARDELVRQIDSGKHPKTRATVDQLFEAYMGVYEGAKKTVDNHKLNMRLHISPFIGSMPAMDLTTQNFDELYAEGRRCRTHCKSTSDPIDHRTPRPHTCDHRCKKHVCKPLGSSVIRHIHFLLRGAFKKAFIWEWITSNPVVNATPPRALKPNPHPLPLPDVVRVVKEAFRLDLMWGLFIWLLVFTGARRAEPCTIRFDQFELDDLDNAALHLLPHQTKSGSARRVALDRPTAALFADYRDLCRAGIEALGLRWDPKCYVFSKVADHSEPWTPEQVGQRYGRMATRLGVSTGLHDLWHFTTSELIRAGVDVRTVAGRIGHSDGGNTTLRVYAAWFAEADQRAATTLQPRLPDVATIAMATRMDVLADPRNRCEQIAADLRQRILDGSLTGFLPPMKEIALANGVSLNTAKRAVTVLRDLHLVELVNGRRTRILSVSPETSPAPSPDHPRPVDTAPAASASSAEPAGTSEGRRRGVQLLDLRLYKLGETVKTFKAEADPDNPGHLRRLLTSAPRRVGGDIEDFELEIALDGTDEVLATFVVMDPTAVA